MKSLQEKALEFAIKAHGDQKRKYTEEPYIMHCIRVAETVRSVSHSDEMIAAAYLHDVVEDTPVSIETIGEMFGEKVRELVLDLTDEYVKEKYPNLNRSKRKKKEVLRQSKISAEAKTIKLADVIDNTPDIVKNDPGFALRYVPEMRALVNVLKEGDSVLLERALDEVSKGLKYINRKKKEDF